LFTFFSFLSLGFSLKIKKRIMKNSFDPNWEASCGLIKSRCEELTDEDKPHLELSPINSFWWVFVIASCFLIIGFSVLIFWKWKRSNGTPTQSTNTVETPRPRRRTRFSVE